MATPQNGEPSKIIGSISKFAGTLVGSAVIAGKRIFQSTPPPGKEPSDKPEEKTSPTRNQRKKKAVRTTKKKKAVKRKGAGSSGKSETSKKEPVQSPAKKKKVATPKKKKAPKKTKKTTNNEVTNHAQGSLTSETGPETNVPIEKQKYQAQLPIADAEMADEKSINVNGSPEEGVEKRIATESQKPSIPIIEYNDKAKKTVVPITSVL
jgi:hypothetical protein